MPSFCYRRRPDGGQWLAAGRQYNRGAASTGRGELKRRLRLLLHSPAVNISAASPLLQADYRDIFCCMRACAYLVMRVTRRGHALRCMLLHAPLHNGALPATCYWLFTMPRAIGGSPPPLAWRKSLPACLRSPIYHGTWRTLPSRRDRRHRLPPRAALHISPLLHYIPRPSRVL